MSSRLQINQHDRSRLVVPAATFPAGSSIATSDSVKLIGRAVEAAEGSAPKIDRSGVIDAVTSDASGVHVAAHFDPDLTDVDTPGYYLCQMQVTVASKPYTAPSDGYLLLVIQPDLGA